MQKDTGKDTDSETPEEFAIESHKDQAKTNTNTQMKQHNIAWEDDTQLPVAITASGDDLGSTDSGPSQPNLASFPKGRKNPLFQSYLVRKRLIARIQCQRGQGILLCMQIFQHIHIKV